MDNRFELSTVLKNVSRLFEDIIAFFFASLLKLLVEFDFYLVPQTLFAPLVYR